MVTPQEKFILLSRISSLLAADLIDQPNPEHLKKYRLYVTEHFNVNFHLIDFINTESKQVTIAVINLKDVEGFQEFIQNIQNCESFDLTIDQFSIKIFHALSPQLEIRQSNQNKSTTPSVGTMRINNIKPSYMDTHHISNNASTNFNRSKIYSLWSPVSAANGSILFTAAFGSFIQMQNWKTLGKSKEQEQSQIWFIFSILFIVLDIVLGATKGIAGFSFLHLLAWYFINGLKQIRFVKKELNNKYESKSFIKPVFIAIGVWLVIIAIPFVIIFNLALNNNPDYMLSGNSNDISADANAAASEAITAAEEAAAAATDANTSAETYQNSQIYNEYQPQTAADAAMEAAHEAESQDAKKKAWQISTELFLMDHPIYKEDDSRATRFDQILFSRGSNGDFEDMTNQQILEAVHKQVESEFN